MGEKAGSALAAACPSPATQILVWTLCLGTVQCYPQPQTYPVRYSGGGNHRGIFNMTMSRSIPQTAASGGGRMVVFPDDNNNPLVPVLDVNGNPACAAGSSNSTFCEKVDNYPVEEIRNLVRKDKETVQELFLPALDLFSKKKLNPDDLSEERVCKQQPQTFFPKLARNDQNDWRYVINDVDYVQAVEAEVCSKEGKACSYVQDNLPAGYQSICRQRFSFKRLLAIDPDEKKTYVDSFRFASCCSCYVKVPRELFGRHGPKRLSTQIPPN